MNHVKLDVSSSTLMTVLKLTCMILLWGHNKVCHVDPMAVGCCACIVFAPHYPNLRRILYRKMIVKFVKLTVLYKEMLLQNY